MQFNPKSDILIKNGKVYTELTTEQQYDIVHKLNETLANEITNSPNNYNHYGRQ